MKWIITIMLNMTILGTSAQESLNVMTFNIRLNLESDSGNAWRFRKDKVASQILFHDAHLVGVQEALPAQMNDLAQLLKGHRWIGVGREDGKQGGEYSAIFFDSSRLNLLASETFWLSETPTVAGSKGWDAALPRIVTWAKFKDIKTGKVFFHFNTHFDHMGKEARKQSSLLILKQVSQLAGKLPVLVTGDFNADPTDEPIQVILDNKNPMHLTDAEAVSQTPHYGPNASFNGWKIHEDNLKEHIDYIFFHGPVTVLRHATLAQLWGTRFSSDHFPVMASVVME